MTSEQSAPPTEDRRRHLTDVARAALAEFVDLSGYDLDRLTGARPEEDGWSLLVDVVELERVPATSSVLATYQVDTDFAGHVTSYQRLRRFTRNATDPA